MAEKFKGFTYPIKKAARGYFSSQDGVNQIKSDVLQLLLTNPGERVLLPDFGTDLRSLIFEPNDDVLAELARERIITAIRTWEPRITVQQIEVLSFPSIDTLSPDDDRTQLDHVLTIRILFIDPEQINEVQELRLEVPLSEG